MREGPRDNPREVFRKGDLAKLRDGLEANLVDALDPELKPGVAYRVLSQRMDPEGGEIVWLGPDGMHPRDVGEFRPELMGEERYRNAVPIAATHLRKLTM